MVWEDLVQLWIESRERMGMGMKGLVLEGETVRRRREEIRIGNGKGNEKEKDINLI